MKISNDQKKFFAITRNFSQIMKIFCRSREISANDEKFLQTTKNFCNFCNCCNLDIFRKSSRIFENFRCQKNFSRSREIFRKSREISANHEKSLQTTRNFCNFCNCCNLDIFREFSRIFENSRCQRNFSRSREILRKSREIFANHEKFLQTTKNLCNFCNCCNLDIFREFSKIFENLRCQKDFSRSREIFRKLREISANHEEFLQITRNFCNFCNCCNLDIFRKFSKIFEIKKDFSRSREIFRKS